MTEVKFYYQKANGIWYVGFKRFTDVQKAIKFIYKCVHSKKMAYSGDVACDDPEDLEVINSKNF